MSPEFKLKLEKLLEEFIQELLRMYALASPIILGYFIVVFEKMLTTGQFEVDWKYLIAYSAIAVLKSLDRGFYESGVIEKGLTRF